MNKITLRKPRLEIIHSTYEDVLGEWKTHLPEYHQKFAVFFEANLLARTLKENEVRECLEKADWIFPDGVAISKLAEFSCGHPVERVSGPTFFLKACEYGQDLKWKHFFYGGTPESLEALQKNLLEKFPGLQIAGSYAPPFRPLTEEENNAVVKQINESGADFLWVGLGGPKQEFWIQEHIGKLSVPVMLGVGAAFDFHSGSRPWAPPVFRKFGLEWLWRMFSGGRHTFFRNIHCVSVVAIHLAKEKIISLFARRNRQ